MSRARGGRRRARLDSFDPRPRGNMFSSNGYRNFWQRIRPGV